MDDSVSEKITVRNPATGAMIAEVAPGTAEDVARAVDKARQAQRLWQKSDFRERGKVLRRFRDLLLDRKEEIADILTAETGKPRSEAYGCELFYVCDGIGFWARHAAGYLKPQAIRLHLLKSKRVSSLYHPIGVIGIISPWNFPLVLTVGEAIPALMAGNAVVIKPSEFTPLTALRAVALAREAGLPHDLLQAVPGYGKTGEALVDNADMVAFTGSVETGKKVARRAGERLIPVTLELGGKDPMIVLRDANLERAANACVWAGLMNSGQVCNSIERVYVEEPVYAEFTDKVVQKVRALRQGSGDDEIEVGSMTSARQLEIVEEQVREARDCGSQVLTGGRRLPGAAGFYYEPTVMIDVRHDMRLMREETFGPVIPIMKVKDREEAVRLANDSRYGLHASVFTRDENVGWEVARALEAGSVCINDAMVNFIIPEAPMGGVKESGLGRRHGAEGIRKYCHQKTVLVDRWGLQREFIWFPNSKRKTDWLRKGLDLLFRSGWKKFFALTRSVR